MADDRWYVGVYYPRPLDMPATHTVDGYVLCHTFLAQIASGLPGKPITYEHQGIAQAAAALGPKDTYTGTEIIRSLNSVAKESAVMHAIGVVADAWEGLDGAWRCMFRINARLFPRTVTMIAAKSLGQLSLSHLHGATPAPLEVSLCNRAARPGCHIEYTCARLKDALQYKANTLGTSHSTMDSQPAAPATISDVLTALSPEHRSLVSAAFTDMDTKLINLNKTNEKSTERVKELETASSVDKSLLKQQITQFLSQISESTRARYAIADSNAVAATLCGNNADSMRRTVDKLLMCCSSVMFEDRIPVDQAKRKTAPSENTNNDVTPPAFEPADTSASAQLRSALSAFN